MTIAGAAPKIAVLTFIFLAITIWVDYFTKPFFKITQNNYFILIIIGIIFIIIGTILIINVAIKLRKSFNSNILMTDGLYRIVRNPMYVSYLIFIIPGICLLFNSWFVFTSILFNLILFKIFIKEEYIFLENKYGEEYNKYLKKVKIKFF